VSVAVKKVPGVASVEVSLSEGMAHIEFAPSNTVSLGQLRKAVNEQGFTPKDAAVIVEGYLETRGKETVFKVSGSGDTYVLNASQARKLKLGKTVMVRALIPSAENEKMARLQIKEVL
jgi:copper chaperone CopZ